MRLYATPSDLTDHDWLDEVPPNAKRLIRSASVKVEHATRMARYKVDSEGMPTEQKHIDAFRDAVCQQAATWAESGLDPNAGEAGQALYVKSQTVDGGSVTLDGHASQETRQQAATELSADTMAILRNAGLTTSHVERL